MLITPGSVVHARARRHLVLDVIEHEACRGVGLAPLDGRGAALTLLHPFDRIDPLPAVNAPRRASRRRVVRACAAAVRASYGANQTRTLADARVSLLPFQLEPALAVLRGEATRVLLADEVGLGKTIQAGLILSELRARQALRRALILTPAGLREQWAVELHERFGLDTTTIDAGALRSLQRTLPPWVNPWTLPGIALSSIDLLKRDELLPQLAHVIWDVVIVDEAHHATRGTDRQHAAALACGRARVVVLITATPHSGERAAFDELCSLGVLAGDPPLRVFRRTRQDARAGVPPRRVRIVGVSRGAAERRLDARLRSYTGRVWSEAGQETGARLAMVVLRKRALSGPASLARSLDRRLRALASGSDAGRLEAQLSLDFADTVGGELTDDDREPGRELEAPGLADRATERDLLVELLSAARLAMREDSKAVTLVRAISAAREPVAVFTEYRDTLHDLNGRLAEHARTAVLHGAMLPAERRRAMAAFDSGRARVLLATDVAAEGLNLQRRCRWIIHYEVPWSPVRIEQRNGRVDRLGQQRRVHVWHLVARDTEEDDVLARVALRSAAAARDLGDDGIAASVFEGQVLQFPERRRTPRPPAAGATREAARVRDLRRLPTGVEPCTRPLSSATERHAHANLVAVYRATVFDGDAREVAALCAGVRAPTLLGCRRVAARTLGRRAARSIAIHESWRSRVEGRERAIAAALADSHQPLLQPSLFDRRLLLDSEHRRAELDRALAELARPASTRAYRVRVSLVGVFAPVRRR